MDPALKQLGIAVLLGLLVGLQREHVAARLAGMRTFPLIAVLGALAGQLGQAFGGWIVGAGLLGVVAILTLPDVFKGREKDSDPGTTTSAAALVMYGVGALLVVGPTAAAVAVGGGVAVLLQFKPELHGFVGRLGDHDLRAIMQFVLLTCVVLPVLPNEAYGPMDVFNPFKTWLLVVLIVGISLGGYIAYKFLGQNGGLLLSGLLGGAISSTATTVSFSRRARESANGGTAAAVVVAIASAIAFVRLMLLVAVVGRETPAFVYTALAPLAILAIGGLVPTLVAWRSVRRHPGEMPSPGNPTQLKSALAFAGMYVVVLFALAAAREHPGRFGADAMYLVAAVSGLTDMDAITVSTAGMAGGDRFLAEHGWRLIVVAALANLVFKAGMAGLLGNWRLLRQVLALFAAPFVVGLALLLFW